MSRVAVAAAVSLVWAALVPPDAHAMTIALCGGDGTSREIRIPMRRGVPPDRGDDHCQKACHAGCPRKRATGKFDQPQ